MVSSSRACHQLLCYMFVSKTTKSYEYVVMWPIKIAIACGSLSQSLFTHSYNRPQLWAPHFTAEDAKALTPTVISSRPTVEPSFRPTHGGFRSHSCWLGEEYSTAPHCLSDLVVWGRTELNTAKDRNAISKSVFFQTNLKSSLLLLWVC